MITKSKIFVSVTLLFIIGSLGLHTHDALAEDRTQNLPPGSIANPLKCPNGAANCGLIDYFNAIVDGILIPIGAVIAVMAFIWAGFLFVTAGGEPKKIEDARRALLYVAIGTAVLLGAKAISAVITGTITQINTT